MKSPCIGSNRHLSVLKSSILLYSGLFSLGANFPKFSEWTHNLGKYALIPHQCKIHKAIPAFKSGNHSSVKCYHPISLLRNISKVLECLIYNEIISKITDFIGNVQFGFLKSRSTLQQLLIFVNEVFTCGTQTDTIHFDIRKAFNSVSHSQLLVKVWSADISGRLWSWFRSYLSDRSQYDVINNLPSGLLPVLPGVPQGSILESLLFLIFHINIHSSIHRTYKGHVHLCFD